MKRITTLLPALLLTACAGTPQPPAEPPPEPPWQQRRQSRRQ